VKPYYQDELVTLYHGDCLEIDAWLDADVLVTDPPYGIDWSPNKGAYGANMKQRGKQQQPIKNAIGNDKDTTVRDRMLDAWGKKPAVVFGSWRKPRPLLTQHRLIWHKAGMPPGAANTAFMTNDEEIYIWGKGFRASSPPLRSVITTNEHRPTQVVQIQHPTPKPIALMELLIDRCPQGVIADPFAGSGATVIAARNLGRRVIAIELEQKYCDLIISRLSQQVFDLRSV
jgi:site-specific DNA-methyltransferase (adenine-specific)